MCTILPVPNYHNFEPEANKHFCFPNLHYKLSFFESATMHVILCEIEK